MDLLLAALALAAGANGGARFLRGHGLRAGKGVACEAGEVVGTLGDDGGDCGDRGRQGWDGGVGLSEVESAGHVADRSSAPGREIGNLGAEASLEESEH